jgi:hypothetical protein
MDASLGLRRIWQRARVRFIISLRSAVVTRRWLAPIIATRERGQNGANDEIYVYETFQ